MNKIPKRKTALNPGSGSTCRTAHFQAESVRLMQKHKEVNWSEVMRNAVHDTLRELGEDLDYLN